MKNIKIENLLIFVVILFLNSCTADFIEEKKDYTSVNIGVYKEEYLANGYVNNLYNLMLPGENQDMTRWSLAAAEHASPNFFSRATDEFSGQISINQEWSEISAINDHCLKSIGKRLSPSSQNMAYTRIRYCNLYLDNIDNYDDLELDFKNQIKGQIYFWRAWQYFELVRLYGGIPLVLTAQPANVDDKDVQIERSSSSDVINQIVKDLENAKELLENSRPYTAEEAGKITSSAAAALKGRVLLTWASPLFNRSDDPARWQRAYDANLDAYNTCLAAGKGLDPDWKNMFFKDNGMESIFGFGFNNFAANSGGIPKNNYTEYNSRSREQDGNGAISPTKNIMDAFPMEDGTSYNPNGNLNHFYRDRDPRFYHTFAYNGCIWPFKENQNYRHWTYYWYPFGYPSDRIASNAVLNDTGIYLRKFTNSQSPKTNNFRNSGADYMEIRFAEVVLNLAESAIGVNKLPEGKGYIKLIRERAGVINNDGDFGLASASSRDQLFAAVINERKVEFAYENKRFHDLRRWLLYNDDYNTCTRLNQTPIEGSKRVGYYTFAKTNPSTYYTGRTDPFRGTGAGIINKDATTYPSGINNYDEYVDYIYDNFLEVVVKEKDVDPTDFTFHWYNEYYFFGIYQQVLDTAPYLQQTQGWGGTFNPLN